MRETKNLTEKEILSLMAKKDRWSYSFQTKDGEGSINSMVFTYEPSEEEQTARFPVPAYCCEIRPNGEFAFSYQPGWSIVVLKTPYCGPVTNEDHFERIQSSFEREAAILNKYKK